MAAGTLNLGPQAPLPHPSQLYFYSSLLRVVYFANDLRRKAALLAGGSSTYFKGTDLGPSSPLWMAADYGPWQVVAVAGTATVEQWQGNVFSVGQVGIAPYPGKVNQYFGVVAGGIAADLQAVVGASSPLDNVVLIGHSLGGAVALLLAHHLNALRPGSVKMVVTFGGPRVGNLEWALGQGWPVLRWENVGDVVPKLPPREGWVVNQISTLTHWGPCQDYYPVGDGWSLSAGGGLAPAAEFSVGQALTGIVAGLIDQGLGVNALPHAAGDYAQRVRYWMGPNLPSSGTLGIGLGLVDAVQATLQSLDGYVWTDPGGH